MSVLTSEQKEAFYRDGYLRFGKVLEMEQVETLRDALARTIRTELERDPDDTSLPHEFRYGHARKGEGKADLAIHQFVNMWKVVPEFREVLDNPLITGAVRELMETETVRLWHDQVISKPPGENKVFAMHHDFYFWPLDRPTMITCWIALDDATPENGCMHVVPGSHRDSRYQPVDCDLSEDIHLSPVPMGEGEPASLYADIRTWQADKAKPVMLKAGECMFHHCLNYHITPENVTDRQRRAFVLIFMPPDTHYKHSQSPGHVCTSYLNLTDGQLMPLEPFPVCG